MRHVFLMQGAPTYGKVLASIVVLYNALVALVHWSTIKNEWNYNTLRHVMCAAETYALLQCNASQKCVLALNLNAAHGRWYLNKSVYVLLQGSKQILSTAFHH